VGDGPERKRWERHARRLQDASHGVHVSFAGWLERSEVVQTYAEADLLVCRACGRNLAAWWEWKLGSTVSHPLRSAWAAFLIGSIPAKTDFWLR